MNLRKIEADALHLSKEERTVLLQKLLLSWMPLRQRSCAWIGWPKRRKNWMGSKPRQFLGTNYLQKHEYCSDDL